MWLADVPGVLGAAELAATVDSIVDWQLPSGMVPWFPNGHADPWNHTEALLALLVGGRRAEAEAGFAWLVGHQRADGSWARYHLADRVEEDKADANVCAYPAVGAWAHWLCHGDAGFLEELWPTLDRAIGFVLRLQQPRGEVLWARHADGTPWPYALLTGSCSISLSLGCALAVAGVLGHERPAWDDARRRLLGVIGDHVEGRAPDAFAPKARWAMDWYYPVLVGALGEGDAARARLAEGWGRFVLHHHRHATPLGVRCVADQPWVTAAETCECAVAHLRVGDRDAALALLAATTELRRPDSGRYLTGLVHPEGASFPDEECSTYTAAAVVLAADALGGHSPLAALFTEPLDRPVDVVPSSPRPDRAASNRR